MLSVLGTPTPVSHTGWNLTLKWTLFFSPVPDVSSSRRPADCSEACQKPGGRSRYIAGLLPVRNPSVAPFSQRDACSTLPFLTIPLNSIRTVNWMTSVASGCALWSSIKRWPAWPPKYSKNYSAFGIKPCSPLTFDIVNSYFLFISLRCHGV